MYIHVVSSIIASVQMKAKAFISVAVVVYNIEILFCMKALKAFGEMTQRDQGPIYNLLEQYRIVYRQCLLQFGFDTF